MAVRRAAASMQRYAIRCQDFSWTEPALDHPRTRKQNVSNGSRMKHLEAYTWTTRCELMLSITLAHILRQVRTVAPCAPTHFYIRRNPWTRAVIINAHSCGNSCDA